MTYRCLGEGDSSYHHLQHPISPPLPLIVTNTSVAAMSVVVPLKAFPNNPISTRRFNNLLLGNNTSAAKAITDICKSTNISESKNSNSNKWRFATYLRPTKINLVLVTIILMAVLTRSCEAIPLPTGPIRPSRSVINAANGINNNSNNRLNFGPSLGSVTAAPPSASQLTLQNLHGLDSASSLSIVSPLDILRQNLVMEILRRKQRQSKQRQVQLNKEILDRIG